ncbi:MAG: hypothetical protein HC831_17740 [Chloroflexia bacterium]|nr:hypothetical protein [Chloroflexia bacterium]
MDALSYLSEQRYYKEKIRAMEKKYKTTFEEFESKVKSGDKETFTDWDDYIDWKAYHKLNININKMIEDVRLGNFKVA